jgi:hypothetical protein
MNPSNSTSKVDVPQIRREYAKINEEPIPRMFQKKIFIENPELEDTGSLRPGFNY